MDHFQMTRWIQDYHRWDRFPAVWGSYSECGTIVFIWKWNCTSNYCFHFDSRLYWIFTQNARVSKQLGVLHPVNHCSYIRAKKCARPQILFNSSKHFREASANSQINTARACCFALTKVAFTFFFLFVASANYYPWIIVTKLGRQGTK